MNYYTGCYITNKNKKFYMCTKSTTRVGAIHILGWLFILAIHYVDGVAAIQ